MDAGHPRIPTNTQARRGLCTVGALAQLELDLYRVYLLLLYVAGYLNKELIVSFVTVGLAIDTILLCGHVGSLCDLLVDVRVKEF